MTKQPPIFYSALLLTLVNLLLRTAGTSFQVYISGRIGAAGVGLLQLVLSVGSFTMIAGMAGIRTATMYLCAEELGKNRPGNVPHVLSGCFLYSILCSGTAALILYFAAPFAAMHWIRDLRTVHALRLYAAFLPCVCLTGVMTGFFTARGRIGTLAAVEVLEQLFTMGITIFLLHRRSRNDSALACQCVVFGSALGTVLTLLCLCILASKDLHRADRIVPVRNRLLHTAVPLAAADVLKAGINTSENLMVPSRLEQNLSIKSPLAEFGLVTGMVFPVVLFPACILFGLAELLIPELARCRAADRQERIIYLTARSLKITLLYGLFFSGLIWLTADSLCMKLYGTLDAANDLELYALLIPVLFCDIITDAMIKGLGQQKVCVVYNIITSILDVILLFLLLPKFGMRGYYISFTITHVLNFILSLHRLMRISGFRFPLYLPFLSVSATLVSGMLVKSVSDVIGKSICYTVLLICMLFLCRILSREDIQWTKGLLLRR